ncbi:unnamed protein product [Gadus morhua 'NCC']
MERHQVYLRGADPSGPQTVQVLGLPPVSLDLLTNDATTCTFDLDTALGWEGVRLKVTEEGVVAVQPPSRRAALERGPSARGRSPSPAPNNRGGGLRGDGVNPRYQE